MASQSTTPEPPIRTSTNSRMEKIECEIEMLRSFKGGGDAMKYLNGISEAMNQPPFPGTEFDAMTHICDIVKELEVEFKALDMGLFDNYITHISRLEEQYAHVLAKAMQFESEIKDANGIISKLEAEIKRVKAEFERVKSELERAVAKLVTVHKLEAELDRANAKLKMSDSQLDRANTKLSKHQFLLEKWIELVNGVAETVGDVENLDISSNKEKDSGTDKIAVLPSLSTAIVAVANHTNLVPTPVTHNHVHANTHAKPTNALLSAEATSPASTFASEISTPATATEQPNAKNGGSVAIVRAKMGLPALPPKEETKKPAITLRAVFPSVKKAASFPSGGAGGKKGGVVAGMEEKKGAGDGNVGKAGKEEKEGGEEVQEKKLAPDSYLAEMAWEQLGL